MLCPPAARYGSGRRKSYKVVEFGQPLQKVEEANPAPQGTEVLVRITAAGVCHSDVHLGEGYFDMGGGNKYSTEKTMAPPRTMGHEIVGEVVAVGPEAKGAKVGDKAVVYPWIGCGKCWYCQSGSEHLCPTSRPLGVGAGGVGLMGVRFAKSVLGHEPIVADIDENKRKPALENGACAALDPRDKE